MANFYYMLAPMEDITGGTLRAVCHHYGADLSFTELARVESLVKNNKATWSRLNLKDDTPVEIQLMGSREDGYERFFKMFNKSGGFKGFNLNLGCPSPIAIKNGQGCALIRRISKVKRIISIVKDNGYSCSIKMRLGVNKRDKEKKVYLNLIKAVDPEFFVLHVRTAEQSYKDKVDFSVFEECIKTGKRIVANGDISLRSQADYLRELGAYGVMLGRAAIINPGIFSTIKGKYTPPKEEIIEQFNKISKRIDEPMKYVENFNKLLNNTVNIWKEE